MPQPLHIRIDGVSHAFGHKRVLTDVSMTVPSGAVTCLIGENGSGKSTLLRIVAGELAPDAGRAEIVGGTASIGLFHQEVPFRDDDPIESVLRTATSSVREVLRELDLASAALGRSTHGNTAERYAAALERVDRVDGWNIEQRIEDTLVGLSLADIDRRRPTKSLSGGQRARLSLAWTLLQSPEILILDEPTNHLDAAAASFLGSLVKTWKGPVLIASHDRAFIEANATRLVDLDPSPETGSLTEFTGSYRDYLLASQQRREQWERQYGEEQRELRRARAAIPASRQVGHAGAAPKSEVRMAKKFYGDRAAKVVSRRLEFAKSRVEELEGRQLRKPPQILRFHLPPAETNPNPIRLVNVGVHGRLAAVTTTIMPGEKVLVTGNNGSGKSTLLQVMAGQLDPDEGVITSDTRRTALLNQEPNTAALLTRGQSTRAIDAYHDLAGDAAPSLASLGLLPRREHTTLVSELSTGQRRRLELAIILGHAPAVLLLDEPTNHFSLALVNELESAIERSSGTVVVASHDDWLISSWKGSRLHLT